LICIGICMAIRTESTFVGVHRPRFGLMRYKYLPEYSTVQVLKVFYSVSHHVFQWHPCQVLTSVAPLLSIRAYAIVSRFLERYYGRLCPKSYGSRARRRSRCNRPKSQSPCRSDQGKQAFHSFHRRRSLYVRWQVRT